MAARVNPVTALPVNTTPNHCWGCWTPPGRDHGISCPATEPQPPRFFRGLLNALPIAVALDALLIALLIWSLT